VENKSNSSVENIFFYQANYEFWSMTPKTNLISEYKHDSLFLVQKSILKSNFKANFGANRKKIFFDNIANLECLKLDSITAEIYFFRTIWQQTVLF
jgi:hypothetical protein